MTVLLNIGYAAGIAAFNSSYFFGKLFLIPFDHGGTILGIVSKTAPSRHDSI